MGMKRRQPATFLIAALAALTVVLLAACAPATSNSVIGQEGVDVGNTSPPFAMTLEDGTEVSLKSLVDEDQAAHLFWFATW